MNIVQLNEFEKPRNGVSRQEAVGLLRECREVAFRRLSSALIRMMGKVDDILFEWSEKSEHKADQNLYFDAMRELRLKRASMEIGFKAQLIEGFNREIRKETDNGDDLRAEQMTLVDDAGLEESLAVKDMVTKIEVECKQEVHHLNRRVGVLLNDPEMTRAKNPIGPEVICNAFLEACGDFDTGIKVKLIVLKLFDRHVLNEEIRSLYHELNRLLKEKGILPELRHEIKRAAGTVTGNSSDAGDDAEESESDLYATLQKLMLRGGSVGSVTSAAIIGGLVNALTQLQHGNGSQLEGALSEIDQSALKSGSVNIIREIRTSGAVGDVGAVDGMVIDVIAMLFDYIFDDADIPPTMKALIGRLQIPMLKVGMLDKEFFSRRSHPARKLLNALAQASVGWNADTDKNLYAKIDSVVQKVLESFDKDVNFFSVMLEDFENYLTNERQKAEHLEEQSTKMVQGTERLRLAKQQVRIEVERRNQSNLPKFVRNFLVSYWQNLLLVTLVKEGADSISWKRSLTAMDNLVWSLQPKMSTTERDRLVKLLPGLLHLLRGGMTLISMRDEDFQSFLDELSACHASIVNAVPRHSDGAANDYEVLEIDDDPLADLNIDTGPAVEDKTIMTATIHRLVVAGDLHKEEIVLEDDDDQLIEQVEDAFLAQARELKQGAWVEFAQEDGSALRAKLTWVSPVTGVYLFTNRQGLKACDRTLPSLAADLRRGGARVLDDAPVFERAVSNMIDGLRKQAS